MIAFGAPARRSLAAPLTTLLRALVLTVLGGMAFGASCKTLDGPGLVTVLGVAQRRVALGDPIEIAGNGFPEGYRAVVAFRGTVNRPGARPETHFDAEAAATSSSSHSVVLTLDEALRGRFCGRGDAAAHATFHGDVRVTFEPVIAGAPAVTGVVQDVTIDIAAPVVSEAVARKRDAEGTRFTDFLGVEIERTDDGGPWSVRVVKPSHRGERAGILPGDRLLEIDGVRMTELADFVPMAQARESVLDVRRGRIATPISVRVEVDGFRREPPGDLGLAALLVGVAAAILGLFVAPAGRVLTWGERRVTTRLKACSAIAGRSPLNLWLGSIGTAHGPLGSGVLPLAVVLVVSAYLAALGCGRSPVGGELDLVLPITVSLTAILLTGLFVGGFGPRGWSLWRAARALLEVLACQLPALVAASSVLVMTGGVGAERVSLDQGAAPWNWHVFRGPIWLVAFGLYVFALVPQVGARSFPLPELDSDDVVPERPGERLASLAGFLHLFVMAGVGAVLFLGAWNLPLVSETALKHRLPLQALAAGLVIVKCWGVALVVSSVRWLLPRVHASEAAGLCWRWLMPMSTGTVSAAFAWRRWVKGVLADSTSTGLGYLTLGFAAFVIAYFVRRVRLNLTTSSVQVNVNPWL